MSRECHGFRAALEAELLGRPTEVRLSGLSWHAHLLSCADCRELLEREEALEVLLASLPDPRLPQELARRVLVRLREDRAAETRLDRLLDLDAEVRAPADLAKIVLQGLADARLDALLDLDRAVDVPAGLAARTLARLAGERAPRRRRRVWPYAVAAGLLLAFLGRIYWLRTRPEPSRTVEPVVRVEPAPDPEMLAALDVLEHWDLLMQDDVDVLLSTLAPADVVLLDYR